MVEKFTSRSMPVSWVFSSLSSRSTSVRRCSTAIISSMVSALSIISSRRFCSISRAFLEASWVAYSTLMLRALTEVLVTCPSFSRSFIKASNFSAGIRAVRLRFLRVLLAAAPVLSL